MVVLLVMQARLWLLLVDVVVAVVVAAMLVDRVCISMGGAVTLINDHVQSCVCTAF